MRAKQIGGMVEFIPTPAEKREAIIRDNVLGLIGNLGERISNIEEAIGVETKLADELRETMRRIESEEMLVEALHIGLKG